MRQFWVPPYLHNLPVRPLGIQTPVCQHYDCPLGAYRAAEQVDQLDKVRTPGTFAVGRDYPPSYRYGATPVTTEIVSTANRSPKRVASKARARRFSSEDHHSNIQRISGTKQVVTSRLWRL